MIPSKKSKLIWVGLFAFLLSGLFSFFGVQPTLAALPSKPQYNFYDETNILTEKTEKLVSDRNLYYANQKDKPQVMLAVIKSTDGDSIDDFAPDLFSKWGLGQKGKDNGILILYAVNGGSRNVRIEVGYGLESVITDSIAGRILSENKTNLKSSDPQKINLGLQKTLNSVASLIDNHYGYKGNKDNLSAAEVQRLKNGQSNRSSDQKWWKILGLLIAILVVAFIIGGSGGNGGSGSGPGSRRRRGSLPWWVWVGGSGGSSGGFGSGGSSSGGGFGGFGGFSGGGGSSGGGGASI